MHKKLSGNNFKFSLSSKSQRKVLWERSTLAVGIILSPPEPTFSLRCDKRSHRFNFLQVSQLINICIQKQVFPSLSINALGSVSNYMAAYCKCETKISTTSTICENDFIIFLFTFLLTSNCNKIIQ